MSRVLKSMGGMRGVKEVIDILPDMLQEDLTTTTSITTTTTISAITTSSSG